jgi:hypothetical protein
MDSRVEKELAKAKKAQAVAKTKAAKDKANATKMATAIKAGKYDPKNQKPAIDEEKLSKLVVDAVVQGMNKIHEVEAEANKKTLADRVAENLKSQAKKQAIKAKVHAAKEGAKAKDKK